MTRIYFVDGKKMDLDSSEWNRIYYDGTWSDRGINLFWRRKDDVFVLEKWSNWQGEGSNIEILNREEATNYLYSHESGNHPERVNDAFETINHIPKQF